MPAVPTTAVPTPAPTGRPVPEHATLSVRPARPVWDASHGLTLDLGERTVVLNERQVLVPAVPPLDPWDVKGWTRHLAHVLDTPQTSLHGMDHRQVKHLDEQAADKYGAAVPRAFGARDSTLQEVLRMNVELNPHTKPGLMSSYRGSAALQEALVGLLLARGVTVLNAAVVASGGTVLNATVNAAVQAANPRLAQRVLQRVQAPRLGWLDRLRGHATLAIDSVPLRAAAADRHWSGAGTVIDALMALGVPVDETDSNGLTALLSAVKTSNLEMVRALLQRGADPAAASRLNETPMLRACLYNQGTIVGLLMDAGADPWAWSEAVSDGIWRKVSLHSHEPVTCPIQEAVYVGADQALQQMLRRDVEFFPLSDPDDPTSPRDERWLQLARERAAYGNALPQRDLCVGLLENALLRHTLAAETLAGPVPPTVARPRSRL